MCGSCSSCGSSSSGGGNGNGGSGDVTFIILFVYFKSAITVKVLSFVTSHSANTFFPLTKERERRSRMRRE